MHNTEPSPQKSKPKPRVSAPVTHTTNSGIEILDLVTNKEDPYSQRDRVGNIGNLMIHSKRTTTNFKPLIKKPIYSYSSKEVPDMSLVGFGRSLSCHNQEPPPLSKSPQHDSSYIPPDVLTDYDEAGIDLFMADLIGANPSAQDTQSVTSGSAPTGEYGSNSTFPPSPPELAPGFLTHMDEKFSNPEDQPPSVNGSFIDNWQPHKFQTFEVNLEGSSDSKSVTEESCSDVAISPGMLP